MSGAGVSATIDAARIGSSVAAGAIDNEVLVRNLLANGGLGYLLKVEAEIERGVGKKRMGRQE